MVKIERVAGFVPTRSWGSAFKDLVWAIGMSDDLTLPAEQQINRAFKNLDNVLEEVASDKSQIISATVMLNDIKDKPLMDEVWAKWIGNDPSHWPERSCFGVKLHAGNCIEIRVVAVRKFRLRNYISYFPKLFQQF
jgi:enamine deaminase RidA (YjgF/YER057c/UK114 family)